MDKNIDLIINSKFIDPNKHTTKELHHMDLQETIVLRIKRERWSHLATNYGPEGLQRNSRIIGEAPMEVVNPSVMVPRLDLVVLELATAGIVFRRLP